MKGFALGFDLKTTRESPVAVTVLFSLVYKKEYMKTKKKTKTKTKQPLETFYFI